MDLELPSILSKEKRGYPLKENRDHISSASIVQRNTLHPIF